MKTIRKMGPIGNLLGHAARAGQMKDALAAVDDSDSTAPRRSSAP